MKKILIVNNNLDMGGIQRSLINLLKAVHGEYDVTLLLFSKSGSLLRDVPQDVKIVTPKNAYKMLGLTRSELKRYPLLFLMKGLLIKYTALFSRRSAMKLLGIFQRKIKGYDTVISYSHLPSHKYFGNGCGDFVLDKTVCQNKVCLVHCDYLNSGFMTEQNNAEYREFDKIACCSDSVKERFVQGAEIDSERVYTLRNFYDLDIEGYAHDEPYRYDDAYINIVTVARLSTEKGIDRALDALQAVGRNDVRYYVIGDGPLKAELQEKAESTSLAQNIFFLGEQDNPYRYMLGADYLLVPSFHEAAPMVFDEARILGLSVLTTNTTSAMEMVGSEHGRVCENSTEGIAAMLSGLEKRERGKRTICENSTPAEQLHALMR